MISTNAKAGILVFGVISFPFWVGTIAAFVSTPKGVVAQAPALLADGEYVMTIVPFSKPGPAVSTRFTVHNGMPAPVVTKPVAPLGGPGDPDIVQLGFNYQKAIVAGHLQALEAPLATPPDTTVTGMLAAHQVAKEKARLEAAKPIIDELSRRYGEAVETTKNAAEIRAFYRDMIAGYKEAMK